MEATSSKEKEDWGKWFLDTRVAEDALKLKTTLQKNRHRYGQTSSLLNFESDRKIAQVKPYAFDWNYDDPYMEEIGWKFGFGGLTSRYQDTVNTIFRKVRSRREAISLRVDELDRQRKLAESDSPNPESDGEASGPIISIDMRKFPDPIIAFENAFQQLLAPKTLVYPDPKEQQLFYEFEEKTYPLHFA